MTWSKKLVLLVGLSLALETQPLKAQIDSTQKVNPAVPAQATPELKLDPETKRQRNKTQRTVFVSCLLIVITTILIYNVRSK